MSYHFKFLSKGSVLFQKKKNAMTFQCLLEDFLTYVEFMSCQIFGISVKMIIKSTKTQLLKESLDLRNSTYTNVTLLSFIVGVPKNTNF